jgi:hypothetical protein
MGRNGTALTLGSLGCAGLERGRGARRGEPVQRFRADMRVPAQHLPILVAGDQPDLFDRESGLEQAACAFVAQIVEMKVLHADLGAGAPEGCTDRFRVIGKDPSVGLTQMLGLRHWKRNSWHSKLLIASVGICRFGG